MRPVRFGIIGTNFISDWFAEACTRTEGRAVPTAVLSRRIETGQAFAAQHGLEQSFTELDALCAAVDAVYVASPNALHHPQALQAIAAGKHVLIEKTMATSAAEVTDILAAAERHGVIAMEAMRPLHAPAHQIVREAIPRVGTVRQVHFAKCQYSSRYDRFRAGEVLNAFNPALGNSALADIGVYPLQPVIDLFGAPEHASGASVTLDNGFEGVGSMTLRYPTMVAEVTWSKITRGVTSSVILGEDGAITLDDPAEPSLIQFIPRGGAPETLYDQPATPSGNMHHEIIDFCDQIEAGAMDVRWASVSLHSRVLMDAHLAEVGH